MRLEYGGRYYHGGDRIVDERRLENVKPKLLDEISNAELAEEVRKIAYRFSATDLKAAVLATAAKRLRDA